MKFNYAIDLLKGHAEVNKTVIDELESVNVKESAYDKIKEQMDAFNDAIALLEAIGNGKTIYKWIPEEQELPSDDRYVLVSFANYDLPAIAYILRDEDGNGKWMLGDDRTALSQYLFVNAWMELPECYREDDENEEKE